MDGTIGKSTFASSLLVIMFGVVLAFFFAIVRLPFMHDPAHFQVIGPRRPMLNSIVNSLSVQFFAGGGIATPVSVSMQIVYIVQMLIAFLVASSLFMTMATHIDRLIASSSSSP